MQTTCRFFFMERTGAPLPTAGSGVPGVKQIRAQVRGSYWSVAMEINWRRCYHIRKKVDIVVGISQISNRQFSYEYFALKEI